MNQDRQNSQRRDAQNTEREQDFTTYRTAQSSNDMVPTVFRRGIYRTIRGSLKRFLSIVVITALGVSVMCGLKAGCEDLCDSVDAYFDQQNVYDINVQSTYGLTDDDIAAIQEVDGVETAEGIYTETAYTAVGTTRERVVVQSLSKENIDQPVLVRGELPETSGEVAVTSRFLKASGKKIGDTVSFAANDASSSNQSAKDQFADGDYTITAEVLDPTDVSSDSTVNAFRAASTADYKFYVSEDAATSSSYSAVHVVVEGAKSLNSYSDAYSAKINEVKGNIEKIREEREKARAQELTVDTPASLDAAERQANMVFGIEQDNINRMAEGSDERAQAQADLDQRRAAADQQFADARAELSDLGECTWYIQDRGNIASYSSVESDSSSIEAIATVFPFIFFIVAVLISLTTATRMVEEERTLIGLYKALGYSRGRILSKYVDYSLWACLIGGVLGNIIGFVGLPLFLFTVFDDMYSLPQMLLSYDIVSSIVSVALFAVPPRDGRDPCLAHAPQGSARRLAHSARAHWLYLAPHGLFEQGRCTQPVPLQKARLYDHLRYRWLHGARDLRYGHPRYVGGAFAQAVRAYHALRPAGGRQSRRFFADVRGARRAKRSQGFRRDRDFDAADYDRQRHLYIWRQERDRATDRGAR